MGKAEALQPGVVLRALLDGLLTVVVAPPCAACGEALDSPLAGAVCEDCWRSIVPLATPFRIDRCTLGRALGAYEGPLREIVHALKYQRRRSLARPLGALMARHCHDVCSGADFAVAVPLHPSRHRERGFNQAALLARALPLARVDALSRVRATSTQTDLPADRRRENVRGAFRVRDAARHAVRGAAIVLVDDVMTTGATLGECARVLTEAGAREVRAVTAARAL